MFLKLSFFFFITNSANFFNMLYSTFSAKLLNHEIFAIYSLTNSITLTLGGIHQILHYLLSKHISKFKLDVNFNLKDLQNLILYFSFLISIIITLISFFIIEIKYPTINHYIFAYIFLLSFVTSLSLSQLGIMNGEEKHYSYSLILFSTSLVRLILLLSFIYLFSISYEPFLANIISGFFSVLLLLHFYKLNYFTFNFKKIKFNALKLFKSFLVEKRIIIFNFLMFVLITSDIFLFSANKNLFEIANFSVHAMFAKVVYYMFIPLSIFFFPKFSKQKIIFGISNLLIIISFVTIINIVFFFSIKKFFFLFFTEKYEFDNLIFIYLLIFYTCFFLCQISGEYLVTRYVNKIYIYIITIIISFFIIFNFVNNNYFFISLLILSLFMFFINIYFIMKPTLTS